ncbi:hypothetical protein CDAR_543931 [Caerostris darwini]|uniref:Uncharacterized protein n=1 Tax=Caerostris darwini TaxID=1538125 RepID=A0AAV4TP81_9ARAC|nr:hypothetical protein CDAR_543931 [Caerostris darwini]
MLLNPMNNRCIKMSLPPVSFQKTTISQNLGELKIAVSQNWRRCLAMGRGALATVARGAAPGIDRREAAHVPPRRSERPWAWKGYAIRQRSHAWACCNRRVLIKAS